MASSSIFTYKICSDTNIGIDLIYSRLKQYPESDNMYFNLELVDDNEISGEYVMVKHIREVFYNPEDRSFSDRVIPKAEVIPFLIKDNFLEIWGSKTSSDRVLFTFSQLFPQISFYNIEISISTILQKLKNYKIQITKVCLQDFLLTEDIVGNFTVDLSSYGNAYKVLQQYTKQIANMTILVYFSDNSIKIRVTNKGRITVYKTYAQLEEEEQEMLFDLLTEGRDR